MAVKKKAATKKVAKKKVAKKAPAKKAAAKKAPAKKTAVRRAAPVKTTAKKAPIKKARSAAPSAAAAKAAKFKNEIEGLWEDDLTYQYPSFKKNNFLSLIVLGLGALLVIVGIYIQVHKETPSNTNTTAQT